MAILGVKKIVFIVSFLVLFPIVSFCTELRMTMENDVFIQQDDDYTHGTEFEFITDDGWHYVLSQTMYAPGDLRETSHIKGDRPYCGMLLGGVGYEFSRDVKSNWSHYGELDFGMIGPSARCKETQTFVHKLLDCKKPMGWDNQLSDEFVVNGQWWTKYSFGLCDWVELVPRAGALVGTAQDAVEVGCDLRVGWNLRPSVGNDIMFSSPRGGVMGWLSRATAYAYVGVGERFWLYNHVLEGSLFGSRDGDLGVDIERFVGEARCGFVLKVGGLFATVYGVFREREFKGQSRSPSYGGFGIGFEW